MKVKFKEWECDVILQEYKNGGTRIQLFSDEYGPIATATVWVPVLGKNEVAIKDYSENEGMLKVLVDVGLISEPIRYFDSEFVSIPICELLVITEF